MRYILLIITLIFSPTLKSQDKDKGKDKKEKTIAESVEVVVTQVGRSGLIAMLTTISVFSILSFSDFQGFSEFGKIATMGIICAFVTYYFLFPAQALFYDKIHWLGKPKPRLFNLKISNLYSTTPFYLSLIFLFLLILSLFLLPGIEFEYDFQKLRGEDIIPTLLFFSILRGRYHLNFFLSKMTCG